jgi:hypothetical protein
VARYKLSISPDKFECKICGKTIPPETEFYLRGKDDARCKRCREALAWAPPRFAATEETLAKINSKTKKIEERVVFLIVHFHALGNQRKVETEEIEVERADKDRLSVAKRLLASPEYEVIKGFDSMIVKYLNEICSGNYDPAVRVLSLAMVEQAESALRSAVEKRAVLVERFVEAYPKLKEEARKALGKLFEEKDYPPVDQVAASFRMDWSYLTFATPGNLSLVNPEMFSQERKKIAAKMEETFKEIRDTMRLGLLELVTRLNDALKPGEDGKQKKLTAASVEKLQDFLQTSPFRNVTGDADLERLTAELRKIMSGLDRDKLAENEGLQERVQKTMASVAVKLEVMTKGARKFRIET